MATLDFLRNLNTALNAGIQAEQVPVAPVQEVGGFNWPSLGPQESYATPPPVPNISPANMPIKTGVPPVAMPTAPAAPAPAMGGDPRGFLSQFMSLFSPSSAQAQGFQPPANTPAGVVALPGGGQIDFRGLTTAQQTALMQNMSRMQSMMPKPMSMIDQLNYQLKAFQVEDALRRRAQGPKVDYDIMYDRDTLQAVKVDKNAKEIPENLISSSLVDDLMRERQKQAAEKEELRRAILYGDIPGSSTKMYSEQERLDRLEEWNRKYPDSPITYIPAETGWFGREKSPFRFTEGVPMPQAPSDKGPSNAFAAPPQAIEYLKQNPQLKEQFKAKYGYIPEGM